MNYESLFAPHRGRTVRAALIGAGEFGVSLVTQTRAMADLDVTVICDSDPERARGACRRAGWDDADIRDCETEAQALQALEDGKPVVVTDAALVPALPVDIVVEATGNPEAAARIAESTIEGGKHLAMVTKECESVIGPGLAAMARAAGLVYTPVDGDQPSLLIGLVSWARTLGLDIVTAGKSSEYDFVYDPESRSANCQGNTVAAPGLDDLWHLPDGPVSATVAARAGALAAFQQRTVPDLCEMSVVINATGLAPDRPEFHVPIARTTEVPGVLCPHTDGGVLAGRGVVDVFNCLRRPDEASFAGGVFVVVECHDRDTWQVLGAKGHPVSPDGRYAMLYNPQHLLGLEAPMSLLGAVWLGLSSGGGMPEHRIDLCARTGRDFARGEVLAITNAHHHEVEGLEPLLLDARPATGSNPLPYYMVTGRPLLADAPAGTLLTADLIEPDPTSALWRLRARFDGGH